MDWSEQVITEFGHQIGIQGLKFNDDQRLHLKLDDDITIGMGCVSEIPIPEFLVYLSKSSVYLLREDLKKILFLSNHQKLTDWPLQVGCSKNKIFLCFRIPLRSISLSSLNEAISSLKSVVKEAHL